jgi:hypothetical protein
MRFGDPFVIRFENPKWRVPSYYPPTACRHRRSRSQDALGLVYERYRRHAEQGEILDDALLVFAARVRAEGLSRV